MSLFRKSPPPLWFILHPSDNPSRQPKREGPYSRATIAQLIHSNSLPSSTLFWTNEKIFPNPLKPKSSRTVRIPEWRRLDQLPDPVVRQLHEQAKQTSPQSTITSIQDPNLSAPELPTNEQVNQILNGNNPIPSNRSHFSSTSSTSSIGNPRPATSASSVYPVGAEEKYANPPSSLPTSPQPSIFPASPSPYPTPTQK